MKTQIAIRETEEELKRLLSQTTDGKVKEKLQTFYWLKTQKIKTITESSTSPKY